MGNNLFYLIISWGGAVLLLAVGIYAMKRRKPMWLGIGNGNLEEKVKDVTSYNRAVGKMWCLFSIPLWIEGIIILFIPAASLIFFVIYCTAGIGAGAWWQSKIEKKYIS